MTTPAWLRPRRRLHCHYAHDYRWLTPTLAECRDCGKRQSFAAARTPQEKMT